MLLFPNLSGWLQQKLLSSLGKSSTWVCLVHWASSKWWLWVMRSQAPSIQWFNHSLGQGSAISRTGSVVENQLVNILGFVGYEVFVTTTQLCGMKAAIGCSNTGFRALKPTSDLSLWPIKKGRGWVLVWEIVRSRTCKWRFHWPWLCLPDANRLWSEESWGMQFSCTGRKAVTNLDSVIESRDTALVTKSV